jgi:hypothetical protein
MIYVYENIGIGELKRSARISISHQRQIQFRESIVDRSEVRPIVSARRQVFCSIAAARFSKGIVRCSVAVLKVEGSSGGEWQRLRWPELTFVKRNS